MVNWHAGAGQYNETVFRAIDYMLAQAEQFNLKVGFQRCAYHSPFPS